MKQMSTLRVEWKYWKDINRLEGRKHDPLHICNTSRVYVNYAMFKFNCYIISYVCMCSKYVIQNSWVQILTVIVLSQLVCFVNRSLLDQHSYLYIQLFTNNVLVIFLLIS